MLALSLASCRLIYTPDVSQGNLLDKKTVDQLQPGMTKRQVLVLMGSPSVNSPFSQNEWDYVSTQQHRGGDIKVRALKLTFNNDVLVQAGEVRSRGLEIELRTRIGRSASLIAAYAYTDARVTADTTAANVGKRRGNVPYNTFSAWGEYDFGAAGVPGLRAGLGVRHVGASTGLYVNGIVPSYTVFDAMVSYDTGHWRYAFNLTNLADKAYIASCTYGCFYGERRKAVASATYRW